jgi:hypothetical protein
MTDDASRRLVSTRREAKHGGLLPVVGRAGPLAVLVLALAFNALFAGLALLAGVVVLRAAGRDLSSGAGVVSVLVLAVVGTCITGRWLTPRLLRAVIVPGAAQSRIEIADKNS